MTYEIHPLANTVAMANLREQQALTHDISVNGQNEPAVLWKGKIVDGRCRQVACSTLGVPLIVRSLKDDMPEEDVAKLVKSLNTRRNLTATQKLASAYKAQLGTNKTNAQIAIEWAVSVRSLQNFKFIAEHRPELVEPLFKGESVVVTDPEKGHKITTHKVNTLARIIKVEAEAGKVETITPEEVEAKEYNVNNVIATEKGRQEHRDLVNAFKSTTSKEQMFSIMAAELMNYKYRIE